jgi:hypothetical protein
MCSIEIEKAMKVPLFQNQLAVFENLKRAILVSFNTSLSTVPLAIEQNISSDLLSEIAFSVSSTESPFMSLYITSIQQFY